jgi:hypothetical protein
LAIFTVAMNDFAIHCLCIKRFFESWIELAWSLIGNIKTIALFENTAMQL